MKQELENLINNIQSNHIYHKKEIMGLLNEKPTKIEVVKYVYENTGIRLYAYLRNKEARQEYLSGVIDINYFNITDDGAYYCVGEVGVGIKDTIGRASVIRKIEAVEHSKLIFQELLPLMGIEFVRYGMLTVVPFPFKYLREYIQIVKNK